MKKIALLAIITTQSMSMQTMLRLKQRVATKASLMQQAAQAEARRKMGNWKEKYKPTECPYTTQKELAQAFLNQEIDEETYRIFYKKIPSQYDN